MSCVCTSLLSQYLSSEDMTDLEKRIADLEMTLNNVLHEKKLQEEDFAQKRAKFKDIYLQREGKAQSQFIALRLASTYRGRCTIQWGETLKCYCTPFLAWKINLHDFMMSCCIGDHSAASHKCFLKCMIKLHCERDKKVSLSYTQVMYIKRFQVLSPWSSSGLVDVDRFWASSPCNNHLLSIL